MMNSTMSNVTSLLSSSSSSSGGVVEDDIVHDVHNVAAQISQEIYADLFYKLRDPNKSFDLKIYIEAGASYNSVPDAVKSFVFLEILKHLHQLSLLTPTYLVGFGIIYCFLILFGVLFNVLIIFAFIRAQKLRTFRNAYVINLAISDLLLCTVCAPLTILKYTYVNWPLSRFWCKFGQSFQTVNTLVCAFSLATIAIDRWIFILHTGKDKTNKLLLYGSILMIWLLAIVTSLPIYSITEVREFYFEETEEFMFRTCDEMWPNLIGMSAGFNYIRNVYLAMIFLLQYVIPVILVTLTNLKICHFLTNMPTFYPQIDASSTLRANSIRMPKIRRAEQTEEEKLRVLTNNKHQNNYDESTTQPDIDLHSGGGLIDSRIDNLGTEAKLKRQSEQTLRETCFMSANGATTAAARSSLRAKPKKQRFSRSKKILLFVCLSFTICWLPLLILNFFNDFFNHQYNVSWRDLAPLFLGSHLIAILSTSINPILYGLLNKNFFSELTRIGNSLLPSLFTARQESGVYAPSEKNASMRRRSSSRRKSSHRNNKPTSKNNMNNNNNNNSNNHNDKKVDETAVSNNIL